MESANNEILKKVKKFRFDNYPPNNFGSMKYETVDELAANFAMLERAEAIEECAKFLDDEVARHRADYEGEIGHSFCEDYGCNSLTRFASALRAKLTPAPEAEKKCSTCGEPTDYCCVDCMIERREKVYVCGKPECRDVHEAKRICQESI